MGTGATLGGDPAPVTEINEIAKACGYKKVVTVSADDLAKLEEVLKDAMDVSGKGITETIVAGLRLVRQSRAHGKAMALRGKITLDVDLDESRERRRR